LYPEGNEIYDLFIHPIDLVVFLFGEAKILAMHKVKSTKKGGVTYLLMLEHDNIIGTLELSTLYSWKDASENVRVNTQDGTYEVDQMGVSEVEGVFFKSKKTLPFNTIQDVTINTGPILNKYKLANIQVTGIYSKLTINYLPIEKAEKLKEKILKERSKYNIEY